MARPRTDLVHALDDEAPHVPSQDGNIDQRHYCASTSRCVLAGLFHDGDDECSTMWNAGAIGKGCLQTSGENENRL